MIRFIWLYVLWVYERVIGNGKFSFIGQKFRYSEPTTVVTNKSM